MNRNEGDVCEMVLTSCDNMESTGAPSTAKPRATADEEDDDDSDDSICCVKSKS